MSHLSLKYFSDTHGNGHQSACDLKLTLENICSQPSSGSVSKYQWFLTTETGSGGIQLLPNIAAVGHSKMKVSLRLDSGKHTIIVIQQVQRIIM